VSEDLQQHVGLTDSQYGMGAGVFFVGYCLFQVPSQMVLVRIGERNWLGFMAFAWGIACCAMAACTDVESFYRARFALGVAEAGFFPGAMSFLRLFLPKNQFGFAYGMIVASMCTAMVCGGPLAASVMELTGDGEPGGLAGWQWLFLAQGLPAVALGLSLFCWLPAKPVDIDFGSSEKAVEVKRAYLQKLQDESFAAKASSAGRDGAADKKAGCVTLRRLCGDTRMWAFATCFFFHSVGFWGLVFWVPRVVGAVLADSEADPEHLTSIMGSSTNATISLVAEELADIRHVDEAEPVETVSVLVLCLSAVPYLGAVAGSLLNSWHSDRTGERRWHLICSLLLGSFGLFLTASTLHQPKANMISLTLTAFGLYACSP
jgi:MFS family permease